MRVPLSAPLRRPLTLIAGLLLGLGLASCGKSNDPPSAENNGVYVQAGPITYQLQVSRLLNQYSTEDSQYVKGLPASQRSIGPNQLWYGVFLWAKNQGEKAAASSDNFDIVDTVGNRYFPVRLRSSANPFAWSSQRLAPGAIQPGPGTIASWGPTQGELLLFKLNQTVFSDRPLTLQILSPTGKVWGTVSLDL